MTEYLVPYLAVSPFFAALAAKQNPQGVIFSTLMGLLWPFYLLIVVIYTLLHLGR